MVPPCAIFYFSPSILPLSSLLSPLEQITDLSASAQRWFLFNLYSFYVDHRGLLCLFPASYFASWRSDWLCFSVLVSLTVFVFKESWLLARYLLLRTFLANFLLFVVLILYLRYGTGTVCDTLQWFQELETSFNLNRFLREWLWSMQNVK
jgi:hypothetical protein